jgi:hypothetical protein
MNGIIFAGDSFTWGQGLHHYSTLPNVVIPKDNQFFKAEYSDAHLNFIKTIRFPRIVANYFETFEIVQLENGGNEDVSFELINHCFQLDDNPNRRHLYKGKYEFADIEYIILQTSQPDRNKFKFEFKGKEYIFNAPYAYNKAKKDFEAKMADFDIFNEWLESNNKTYEEWQSIDLLNYVVNNIKEQFNSYEKMGIKTKLLCWTPDYINIIKNDEFLNERFITLKYNNKEYNCIYDLTKENENLIIRNDFKNLKNPPPDSHISKECHQLIANNIIENINSTKNLNKINNEYKKRYLI